MRKQKRYYALFLSRGFRYDLHFQRSYILYLSLLCLQQLRCVYVVSLHIYFFVFLCSFFFFCYFHTAHMFCRTRSHAAQKYIAEMLLFFGKCDSPMKESSRLGGLRDICHVASLGPCEMLKTFCKCVARAAETRGPRFVF